MVISIEARRAVQAYLADPNTPKHDVAHTVLGRLAADREGKVSAALNRLKSARNVLVLSYLIQAVDLATSSRDIVSQTTKLADDFLQFAESARALAAFSRERASMRLWHSLPELAQELEEQALVYRAQPAVLQISNKKNGPAAEQILAMRRFGRRLRAELGIECKNAKQKEAVRWLIESALDCAIPNGRVTEALRPGPGRSRRRKPTECPKTRSRLKTRKIIR